MFRIKIITREYFYIEYYEYKEYYFHFLNKNLADSTKGINLTFYLNDDNRQEFNLPLSKKILEYIRLHNYKYERNSHF